MTVLIGGKHLTSNQSRFIPTLEMLAALGTGHVAYIRPLTSVEASKLYPHASELKPGRKLFTLNAADGTPILLAESEATAVANAWENELMPVAVH